MVARFPIGVFKRFRIAADQYVWLLLLVVSLAHPSFTNARVNATIDIQVLDDDGRPLQFVTVWQTTSPCGPTPSINFASWVQRDFDRCLAASDLLALARRIDDTFEYFVSNFTPRPADEVTQRPMLGPSGRLHIRGPIRTVEGTLGTQRVPRARESFVFLKFGYDPAAIDVDLTAEAATYRGVVKLARSARTQRTSAELREAFETARYQLSLLLERDLAVPDVDAELGRLRRALMNISDEAQQRGDGKLAAFALTTVRYLPAMVRSGTGSSVRVWGYSKSGIDSDAPLLRQASRLDPSSPFWAAFHAQPLPADRWPYFEHMPTEAEQAPWLAWLDARERQLLAMEPNLWPVDCFAFAEGLARLGFSERAYAWLDRFRRQHPRVTDITNSYMRLRQNMRRFGQPVPSYWVFPD